MIYKLSFFSLEINNSTILFEMFFTSKNLNIMPLYYFKTNIKAVRIDIMLCRVS